MEFRFEMSLPSTGDDIYVEYEYLEGDESVGESDGFDYSISTDNGEIGYELTEADYDEIKDRIQAHYELQCSTDSYEAAIARWEANND